MYVTVSKPRCGCHGVPFGSTQTPITLIHATLQPGAEIRLPWRKDYNALVYTLAGHGFVGEESRPVQMGQLTVFGDGDTIVVRAANVQELL